MRFAAHILYFDCDALILRAIANMAPWVERFYIAYSPKPWKYNAGAAAYCNESDTKLLRESEHWAKIELIEGEWDREEAQRNACVDRARHDGFDYLLIQDADEFYLPEEIEKNLNGIRAAPEWPYYRSPWYLFWKTTQWVIVHSRASTYKYGRVVTTHRDTLLDYNACFALNLRSDVRFESRRLPTRVSDYLMLDGVCHHLSYVLNDHQMWRKINTWGHAHEFDRALWYDVKWLGWTPATRDLSPLSPTSWRKTVRYEGQLPAEIVGFDPGLQEYKSPPFGKQLRAWQVARARQFRSVAQYFRYRLRTHLQR